MNDCIGDMRCVATESPLLLRAHAALAKAEKPKSGLSAYLTTNNARITSAQRRSGLKGRTAALGNMHECRLWAERGSD